MFTVAVNTRQAIVGQKELLTSGSVGIEIQFTFSGDWAGLTRTAVFRLGEDEDTKTDVVLTETNTCVIPHEVLEEDGEPVFAGVYGFDGETNEIVIPTVWASLGVVRPGVKPGTPATPAPTPSVVEQIQAIATEAHQAASDAQGYTYVIDPSVYQLKYNPNAGSGSKILPDTLTITMYKVQGGIRTRFPVNSMMLNFLKLTDGTGTGSVHNDSTPFDSYTFNIPETVGDPAEQLDNTYYAEIRVGDGTHVFARTTLPIIADGVNGT